MDNYPLNTRFFLIVFFILYCVKTTYSQAIKGSVLDVKGNPIAAKVLIKKLNDTNAISEFVLVSKGKFNYNLKKSYVTSGIYLEVIATGYTPYKKTIKASEIKNPILLELVLFKEQIQQLDEVYIKAKRAYHIKKDTVVFNVKAYTDGTEKKVEDLLKKLPGIEVDNTGIIKYRGKSIETVTIEGDNLFDYNYTIGTKNINLDLVKEIEAIENYSENKLLKDLENSSKVALNLKLKENKTNITGSSDLGVGDFPDSNKTPLDLSVNLLKLNKKSKSFATTTYNNIGKNSSPFNYLSRYISLEQTKDKNYYAQKIIPESDILSVTNNNLSNINNQIFSNFNSIYNLSKKVKAKINLFYTSDKIKNNSFSESNIKANNLEFVTFDHSYINRKPLQYRGDLEFKFNTSKSSLLQYSTSFRNENINTTKSIFSNQRKKHYSLLNSKSLFFKQKLEFTQKITGNRALQINLLNSINHLNQNFNISPSVLGNQSFNKSIQNNNSKKENTTFKTFLLGKTKQNNKYSISVGFNLDKEMFNSNLLNKKSAEVIKADKGVNDLIFKKNEVFVQSSYHWSLGKFKVFPSYSFRYLYQNLTQNNYSLNSKRIVFEPSLNLSYKVDRTTLLNFSSGLNNNTQPIQRLFANKILIDNRIIQKNTPNISLQNSVNYTFLLSKNDLFNQLELSLGANYTKQKGNYFTNTNINESTTKITRFFLPENIENINFHLNFAKLLPLFQTNIKITSNYSIFNFKNIVNNSKLKNNKSSLFINHLFLKTAFNKLFNFENKTIFTFQKNKSQTSFTNKSLENNFKLIFKPSKQFYGSVTYHFFIPRLTNKANNYSFLSSKISFKPKNKKWKIDITGVNLLNENFFIEKNTSDFSINTFRVNLLNRHYLLNFSYSF